MDIKKALDDKIKKLQMIRALADDPEAMQMLLSVIQQPAPASPVQLSIPTAPARIRGEQQIKVKEVLEAATEPVTTKWIVAKMQESGYQFNTPRPGIAVNECLRILRDANLARVVRREGVENYWQALKEIGPQ